MIGIYVRVSTEEQVKKGYSIRDQIQSCRLKATTLETIEYIDEGISGEFLDRPALTKLREDVRKGLVTKIVCLDPDRLSRKLMNQLIISEELEKKGVELLFVNGDYAKTPEGQLFYSMRGAISEFEKAKITERMSRGRREKARQGKVVKDPKIYGYAYDKQTEQLIINEQEAHIVREIFELFVRPNGRVKGINGIAHYLTDRQVPTKRGAHTWHRQVIRQILMNRVYIGEFYQNRWNTEGMLGNKYKKPDERVSMIERPKEEWIKNPCPAIIDETTFHYAQKVLGESRRRWGRESKHEYLLSGLVRCGNCKNTMTGRKAKNWGKEVFEYTDRKNTSGAKHKGCGMRITCEKLDEYVWEHLVNWVTHPEEVAAAIEQEAKGRERHSGSIERELTRVEAQIQKGKTGRKELFKLLSEEPSLKEEIMEQIKDLKVREEILLGQLEELNQNIKDASRTQFTYKLFQDASKHYFSKKDEGFTIQDKQELVRSVIKEIVVFKDEVEIYTF